MQAPCRLPSHMREKVKPIVEFLEWFKEEWNDKLGRFYLEWLGTALNRFCERGAGVDVDVGFWPLWFVENDNVKVTIDVYEDDDKKIYKEYGFDREGVVIGPGVIVVRQYHVTPWHFDYILLVPSQALLFWYNIKDNWRRYELEPSIYHTDGVWGVIVRIYPRRR